MSDPLSPKEPENPEAAKAKRVAIGCASVAGVLLVLVLMMLGASHSTTSLPVAASPSSPAPPPAAAGPDDAQVSAHKQAVEAIFALMTPCDTSTARVPGILKRGDVYKAYSAMVDAKNACEDAGTALDAYQFPAPLTAIQSRILKRISTACSLSSNVRAQHMRLGAELLDQGPSPSLVDQVQRTRDQADYDTILCMNEVVAASHDAGFDGWSVMPGDPKAKADIEAAIHASKAAEAGAAK